MALDDSDSSGASDGEYTETNVLLGYASKEPTDDKISQLGGQPTWINPSQPPSAALARCRVCNDMMRLLLQLHGDLPERFPGHERRLYLFTCARRTCRRKQGSVRGLRGTRIDAARSGEGSKADRPDESAAAAAAVAAVTGEEDQRSQERRKVGQDLFASRSPAFASVTSGPANPFATSTTSESMPNPFGSLPPPSTLAAKPAQKPTSNGLSESFASKLALNNNAQASQPRRSRPETEPWPSEHDFPTPYPLYHLDADYETLNASPSALPTTTQTDMAIDNDDNDGAPRSGGRSGGITTEDKEAFESALDKTFQRFADRLSQNPLQVLRYEFGGAPLLYSKADAVGKALTAAACAREAGGTRGSGMARCGNCGAERVFELQLTPHAITELEVEEEGIDGMEWGTVILGVCSRDCVPLGVCADETGYVEEWVGVQWEEVGGKR